jgi:plastocyanin
MFSKLVSATSLISLVAAANVAVDVGTGGLVYAPNSVTAAVGDTVTFTFGGSFHSVVESTFDAPCTAKAGGFSVGAQSTAATFTINVTSTDPIYYYCSVAAHCSDGMVGIINP